jgi:hypothetical protein
MRELREFGITLLGFLAITAVLTFPLLFRLGTSARLENADGQFGIWNVSWVARGLVLDPLRVFDANIFYPSRGTLAYSEANLGAGALAIPVYWTTGNPYAAFNAVLFFSFVFSGTAAYYLARHLTGDRRAAMVAAICFAFCPYVFSHLPHIQLLFTGGLPLSLLALHRLADRPGPRRGAALGLALAVQTYLCAYYGVFAVLAVGYAVILIGVSRRLLWTDRRYALAVGLAAAVALAATLPLFAAYLSHQQETGFARSLESSQLWSTTWRTYLASAAYAHRWMLPLIGRWGEVLFPGFIAVAGGLIGGVAGWRAGGRAREVVLLYASLAALAIWASLGPEAGLYRVLYSTIPGFNFLRTPSRFGVFPILTLSVLTSVALAAWLPRMRRAPLAAAALMAAAVAESFTPLRFQPVPDVNPVYRHLAALPDGPVLELPAYSHGVAFLRARYMLSSTVHWKPLVIAYSDYVPPDFQERLPRLSQFPSRDGFAAVRAIGVRYAVFHLDAYRRNPEAQRALEQGLSEFSHHVRRLYADDRSWLYEITSYPPGAEP